MPSWNSISNTSPNLTWCLTVLIALDLVTKVSHPNYFACFQIYLSCQFDFGLYYKLLNFIFRLIFSKIFVFLTTYNVGTISLSSYIVTLSLIFFGQYSKFFKTITLFFFLQKKTSRVIHKTFVKTTLMIFTPFTLYIE